jgi:uncharacterized membrane protein
MRKLWPGLLVLAAAVAFSLWAAPQLPERVVTHWGVSGEPDGWSSKRMLLVFMPLIGVGMALLMAVLPKIDPRRASWAQHGSTYWTLVNMVVAFFGLMHFLMVGYNIGWPIDITTVVVSAVGVLFAAIGNLMTRMRPNWFMGIRTPWTLSDDTVWRKTHRVGGYLFTAAGVIMVLAALLKLPGLVFIVIGVAGVSALVPIGYSYLLWRQAQERATDPSPRT